MELIDRYLQSVKLMLPRKQQDDVIRELSDEILSQVEEKETALGRSLTEDEQAALLKQLGHPMLLASRYSKQRYLIDPAVFAIYWMVLRLVLAIALLGMTIAAVTVAATGQSAGKALGILFQFPFAALSIFAWVTLVFVILDVIQVKFDFFGKWDPRTLPKLTDRLGSSGCCWRSISWQPLCLPSRPRSCRGSHDWCRAPRTAPSCSS